MGFFEKILQGLARTRQNLAVEVLAAFGKGRLDGETLESLEEKLLAADIGYETSHLLLEGVRKRALGREISPEQLLTFMAEEAKSLLPEARGAELPDVKPCVLLVLGVNGAGKTTSVGKLARYYAAQGKKVMLAACDTFRAGAVSQLEAWAVRAGVELVKHGEGVDAASVAFDAYSAAKARGCDLLIIDTAGRLHTKDNLMEELRKIVRVLRKHDPALPHECFLVLDGNTGQNALPQFRGFDAAVPLTGLIVTKLDGTAKGGSVLALAREFKAPVRWVGVGEAIDDLIPFDREAFSRGLFGI